MSDPERGQRSLGCGCVWCPDCGWVGPCCGECDSTKDYSCSDPLFIRRPLDEIVKATK